MDEEKLSIKINVADRYYPLKIAAADEERIRAAAKRINEKIMQYHQRYVNRDIQDALSMAALQFMMKLMEYEESTNIAPVVKGIQQLDKLLEEYLQNIAD
jgi:cell division protein ZapA